MARVNLELPKEFIYSIEIPVRITDINYASHLGNDSLLGLIHEARVKFFNHLGYTELQVEGLGVIMTDSVILYKAEAFYNDLLKIELNIGDFTRVAFDIYYKVSCINRNVLIAEAKTGMLFFDYSSKKVQDIPEKFFTRIKELNSRF